MPAVGQQFLLPYYADAANGFQASKFEPNPAVGAAFVRVVPGETAEIIVSLFAALTTSATVANRQVILQIADPVGNRLAQVPCHFSQAASLVVGYTFQMGVTTPSGSMALNALLPVPLMVVQPAMRIVVTAVNLQVGDQFSGVAWVLQRYWTGPVVEAPPTSVFVPAPLSTSTLETAPAPGESAPAPAPASAPAPAPATTTEPTPIAPTTIEQPVFATPLQPVRQV